MNLPIMPTLKTISLKGWIIVSSMIMAMLLLGVIFSYATLNQELFKLTEDVKELKELTPEEKVNLGEYKRNLILLWLAGLDQNQSKKFEMSDDALGLCWGHPVANKIENLKVVVASKWLGIEFPEGFQLTLSKIGEPLQCYVLRTEENESKLWELMTDCKKACDGFDFVNRDTLIENTGDVEIEATTQM